MPTLVIGARYDTMDPSCMERMAQRVLKGRYLLCPNGGHLARCDAQKICVVGSIGFLRDVDAGR